MHTVWDSFRAPLLSTLYRIVSFAPRLLVAILLLALFYGIATVVRRLTKRSVERLPNIPWAVGTLIARSVYFITIVIGVLCALSAVNIEVTTVLESLGIAGLVLGFALKDILENFIAGILLLVGRPFELGHQVTLGEFEGTVTNIQIRTTTLTTYGNEIVVIPNSRVYTNPVINHTALGKRRYKVGFATSLKADTVLVNEQTLQAMKESADIAADPPPSVRINSVDAANDILQWQAFYWAESSKAVEVKTVSDILERLKARLYDAGVPTPTATTATILLRSEDTQEVVNPPA